MNGFGPGQIYDRVVSVERFEHMSNGSELLARIRTWLAVSMGGSSFMCSPIEFTHRSQSYRFDHDDEADWIARHVFTGGIMPSQWL
jgi:cyclopropane-fatty-acyl-phospholipid synthase